MIIVLKQGTTKDQISTFSNELNQTYGVTVNAWYGEHSTVLGLLGDTAKIDIEYIRAQAIVESVKRVQEPYKKANRKFHPDNTVIQVGPNAIGDGSLTLIAGPCSAAAHSSPALPPTHFRACGQRAFTSCWRQSAKAACRSSRKS